MNGKKFVVVFIVTIILFLGLIAYLNQEEFLQDFEFDKEELLSDVTNDIKSYPTALQSHPFTLSCLEHQKQVMTESGVDASLRPALSMAFCLCTTKALSTTPVFESVTKAAKGGASYSELVKANYKVFKGNTKFCSKGRNHLY